MAAESLCLITFFICLLTESFKGWKGRQLQDPFGGPLSTFIKPCFCDLFWVALHYDEVSTFDLGPQLSFNCHFQKTQERTCFFSPCHVRTQWKNRYRKTRKIPQRWYRLERWSKPSKLQNCCCLFCTPYDIPLWYFRLTQINGNSQCYNKVILKYSSN